MTNFEVFVSSPKANIVYNAFSLLHFSFDAALASLHCTNNSQTVRPLGTRFPAIEPKLLKIHAKHCIKTLSYHICLHSNAN